MMCSQKDTHTDALMKFLMYIGCKIIQECKMEEEMVIDKKQWVDNYFVCSIGRIVSEEENKVVFVGFNHVFAMLKIN